MFLTKIQDISKGNRKLNFDTFNEFLILTEFGKLGKFANLGKLAKKLGKFA